MPRRSSIDKREILPDPVYHSRLVTKFINNVTIQGKKSTAERLFYGALDLIVVNKPAGMVVHPAPGSETGTLVNALLHLCADTLSGIGGEKRPGIVHRIDKDTSGLLVVAKSDAAHHGLAAQFKDHSIDRRYLAFANGVPSRANPRLA